MQYLYASVQDYFASEYPQLCSIPPTSTFMTNILNNAIPTVDLLRELKNTEKGSLKRDVIIAVLKGRKENKISEHTWLIPDPKEPIDKFAQRLKTRALELGVKVRGKYFGITLAAEPETLVQVIIDYYNHVISTKGE